MSELSNIKQAKELVNQISVESAVSYSRLCGTSAEQAAYKVLDGQLRMASKLAEIESIFLSGR